MMAVEPLIPQAQWYWLRLTGYQSAAVDMSISKTRQRPEPVFTGQYAPGRADFTMPLLFLAKRVPPVVPAQIKAYHLTYIID